MAETIGNRVYLVRLALGDGVRDAMPLREFVALLEQRTGERYSASTISDMETGKRRVTVEDVAIFASVDPRRRGKLWLAWGEDPKTAGENPSAEVRTGAEKYTRPVAPRPAPSGSGFVITPPEHLERAVSFPRPAKPAAKPAKRASGEKKRRG